MNAPAGYHTITPYLTVADVDASLAFVKTVFDGTVTERVEGKDGAVAHAEIKVGDSIVMFGCAKETSDLKAMLYVYVADADARYQAALEAGATSVMEPRETYYGDRNAAVADADGHQWWIAQRVETLSQEELRKRAREAAEN